MKCWICDNQTLLDSVKTRDGKRKKIHFCPKCDFYFFSKNSSRLITNNKFEQERLKTANLKIPDIKTDFNRGIIQSHDYVKKYISKSDCSRNILEIGCSWGYFLKLLKKQGINATGLEINPVRANYVNDNLGIPCYNSLEEIEKRKITFHKIFLFYVIQYIPNPCEYFNRLLNLLEKGGVIYLITPNVNDVLMKVWKNGSYRDFFFEKMTVSYFSVNAMKRLMKVLNRIQSISFNLETNQGYSFLNHLNWYFTGKPRTTGIVGGDKYISDVTKRMSSSNRRLGRELSACVKELDKKYRSLIEKYHFGNQIVIKIIKKSK